MAPDNATFEKQVLELTNQERAKAGLQPLKGNAELDYAADKYAEEMSERGILSHTGPDGSLPWDRAKAVGYEAQTMGENIAAGQETPEQVVQAWMNSPGHRANILNPDFTELGVGFHNNYWGQLFGSGDTNPASYIPSSANSPSQPTSDTNQGTDNSTLPKDTDSKNTLPDDKGTTTTGDTDSKNTLPDDKGNNTIPGGNKGNDALKNGSGDREFKGGNNNDILTGGQGNDKLWGRKGDDLLNGGDGNDRLTGGVGQDKMTGGSGSDRFVFKSMKDKGDIITDFEPSQDVIDMRGMMPGGGDRKSNRFSDRIKLEPVGADTVVSLNMDWNGKSGGLEKCMLLQNTDPSSLTANNFMF
ncbi:MAG: CAP domain-containing protein [Fischerella sp.]|nr:CAP domain-containing protein [Fischerella sp.]